MKNIIFIEGVSGVGKSTTVTQLSKKLRTLGYSVSYHIEGDPDSPLDLCWVSYLTKSEYDSLLISYPTFADELSKNIVYQSEYILLRYQVGRTALYSPELYDELHRREFCYNPTEIAPLSKFTEVFLNLWKQFINSDEVTLDYAIFDASLVSHMTSDLMRNYNASAAEMVKHLEALLDIINHLNPVVFYLTSADVSERLLTARESRSQAPPTNEQILFWEKRKDIDISVLSRLSVKSYIKDISTEDWDSVISEIISHVTS